MNPAPLELPPVVQFPTLRTHPHHDNPRADLDVPALLPSVREHGILQPLGAALMNGGEDAGLLWGHRRLGCARFLLLEEGNEKFRTVPLRLFPSMPPPATVAMLRAVENFTSKKLKPSEAAAEIEALISTHGYSQKEVAGRLAADGSGGSEATVSRLRYLRQLRPEVVALVDAGTIPLSVVCATRRIEDEEQRLELLRLFVEEKWTREKMEHAVADLVGSKPKGNRADRLSFKAGGTSVSLSGGSLANMAAALKTLLQRVEKAARENADPAAFAKALRNGG